MEKTLKPMTKEQMIKLSFEGKLEHAATEAEVNMAKTRSRLSKIKEELKVITDKGVHNLENSEEIQAWQTLCLKKSYLELTYEIDKHLYNLALRNLNALTRPWLRPAIMITIFMIALILGIHVRCYFL